MEKTIGNINFNNLKDASVISVPSKIVNGSYDNHLRAAKNNGWTQNVPSTIINAVEIDWNGAVLTNGDIANATSKTINTTSDLLELVNEMQKEIYVLGAAVISLANSL